RAAGMLSQLESKKQRSLAAHGTATRHPWPAVFAGALHRRLRHFFGDRAVDGARRLVPLATRPFAMARYGGGLEHLHGTALVSPFGAQSMDRYGQQRGPR